VSYFRPQQAGKIGPSTIHSFSDSTSRLSQDAGRVNEWNSELGNGANNGVRTISERLKHRSKSVDGVQDVSLLGVLESLTE
jgi:hypothetical protein